MRRTILVILVIVLALVGLNVAAKMRAPKTPPPTTEDIWNQEGIPVQSATIVRGNMPVTVEVTGNIDSLNKATLSPKIPGRIARMFVREGDPVSAGMTIAVLDQQDALSNLQQAVAGLRSAQVRLSQARTNSKVTRIQTDAGIGQAQASLEAAQAKLEVVKNPSRSQEKMVAENAVAQAKANLDNAQAEFKRNDQLLKEGAISQASFDTVDAQYKVAEADYKSAKDRLSLIVEGGRSEDILAAQAQVNVAKEELRTARANAAQNMLRREDVKAAVAGVQQAEASLAMAKQQLSYTYVKSPIAGQLSSRQAEPGQVVAAGTPIAEAVCLGSTYFKGDVSEKKIEGVKKGLRVDVGIDAVPDRVFSGRVAEIYPSGSELSRNFPVRIDVAEDGQVIRPGMFAKGRIFVSMHSNTMLVPKDAVSEVHGTKFVFTIESREVKVNGSKRVVKVAKRHDIEVQNEDRSYVEIVGTSDLAVGDALVTSGRQNLQDGSKISLESGK